MYIYIYANSYEYCEHKPSVILYIYIWRLVQVVYIYNISINMPIVSVYIRIYILRDAWGLGEDNQFRIYLHN